MEKPAHYTGKSPSSKPLVDEPGTMKNAEGISGWAFNDAFQGCRWACALYADRQADDAQGHDDTEDAVSGESCADSPGLG